MHAVNNMNIHDRNTDTEVTMANLKDKDITGSIKQYIDEYFLGEIDIESLAGAFKITRKDLENAFVTEFGVTIDEYVREKRVNDVTMMVRETCSKKEILYFNTDNRKDTKEQ